MNKATSVLAAMTIFLLLSAVAALAAPNVEIKIKAEKEKVVTKDGKKVTKLVAAKDIVPGEIVQYTILYRNTGDQSATNAVVSDPIPEGTAYIPGSATDGGEITFSIDKGKTFNKPTLLTYETKGPNGKVEKKMASPEDYTTIRWVIAAIPAKAKGSVSFKVRVK